MIATLAMATLLQTAELRWKPTAGATAKYEAMLGLVRNGVTTEIVTQSSHSVSKVDSAGKIYLRSTTLQTLMRAEGKEVRDDRTMSIDLILQPNGQVEKFLAGAGTGLSMRVSALNRFVAPPKAIAVGESYTINRTATQQLVGSTSTYTLVKLDSVATIKVDFQETSGEKPASATGFWTIDSKTGEPQSLELTIQNFETGLGTMKSYRVKRLSS